MEHNILCYKNWCQDISDISFYWTKMVFLWGFDSPSDFFLLQKEYVQKYNKKADIQLDNNRSISFDTEQQPNVRRDENS